MFIKPTLCLQMGEPATKKIKIQGDETPQPSIANGDKSMVNLAKTECEKSKAGDLKAAELFTEENKENDNVNGNESKVESAAGEDQSLKGNQVAERKVGMALCFNKKRFQGIIKQRYSDFMVRECGLDGKPIYLTNTEHLDGEDKSKPKTVPPCPILDEDLLKKIEDFADNESMETRNDKIEFLDNDKEHRKQVHMWVKIKYTNLGK